MPGFEGAYEVSTLGRVWSVPRFRVPEGRLLSPQFNGRPGKTGYWFVTVQRDGQPIIVLVHRAVAAAFIGPAPAGQEVRHLDGDTSNNCVVNLSYGTHGENMADRVAHGRDPNASKTRCPRGHEYVGGNIIWKRTASGRRGRNCRTCHNDGRRARRAAA